MNKTIEQLKAEHDLLFIKNRDSIKQLKERIKRPAFKINNVGEVIERITLKDNKNEE